MSISAQSVNYHERVFVMVGECPLDFYIHDWTSAVRGIVVAAATDGDP